MFLSVQMTKIFSYNLNYLKNVKADENIFKKLGKSRNQSLLWNSVGPNKRLHVDVRTKSVKEILSKISLRCNRCWNKEAMKAEPFLSRKAAFHKNKGDLVPLDIDHKRFKTKYNNIKQQWRQDLDSKKNGHGSAWNDEPEWFIIVNPVLVDANGGINAVCSGPLDTSLVDTNMDEFNSENEVGEDTNRITPPPKNKKVKVKIFVKTLERGKTLLMHALTKMLKMLKTKKRLSLNHRRKEV